MISIASPTSRVESHTQPSTLRHNLLAIRADGALHSAMVGMGENYFAPFALAIGVGQAASGLVTTVPLFLGAVLQLLAPRGVCLAGSYRKWVVLCAALQALSFAPLAYAATVGAIHPAGLFLAIGLYWGAGMATMPAWNTWVGRLVPTRLRSRYFALRTRTSQGALLAGFLLAGCALQAAAHWNAVLITFAAVFALAMISRLGSAACLARQTELRGLHHHRLATKDIVARFRGSSEGRLLVYLIAIQASVQVSGPYFAPFMLKQLHLPYAGYAALVSVSYIAKIAAAPLWGRVAQRHGARTLMWCGGLGVIPIASLWVVSRSFPYLMLVQTASGVCWSAYELAMFLLLFDAIPERDRVSMLTAYNFANSLATVVGSLGGGLLLAALGQNYGAYLAVFAASSVCRLVSVTLLMRVPTPAGAGNAQAAPSWPAVAGRTLRVDPAVRGGSLARSQREPTRLATEMVESNAA